MQEFTPEGVSRLGQQLFSTSMQLCLTPPGMSSPHNHTIKM